MSWLSDAFKKVEKNVLRPVGQVAQQTLPTVLGATIPGVGGILAQTAAAQLSKPRVRSQQTTVMPGAGYRSSFVGGALPAIGKVAGQIGAGVAIGEGVDYLFGNGGAKRKYRRMNYGNVKAAKRAIRRIKGTRKLLQDIERQLPKRAAPRARATGAHSHR